MSFKVFGNTINVIGSATSTYIVNLDGDIHTMSGKVTSQTPQPSSLFSANFPDIKSVHDITITNLGDTSFYIDYVYFCSRYFPAHLSLKVWQISWNPLPEAQVEVDDVDPSFHYEGAWSSFSGASNFYGSTGQ